MECTFEEIGTVLKVALEGRFVAACVDDMRDRITKRMERFPNVIFDLSKMTHIDSSGLGLLVQLLKRSASAGGTVKLVAIQPQPKMVFDITKTYRIFDMYDTVDGAVKSFNEPELPGMAR